MASFCPHCGAQLKDGFTFCPECGTTLDPAPVVDTTANAKDSFSPHPLSPAEPLTKKQFLNLPENAKYKKELAVAGVLCYISSVLTLVLVLAGSAVSLFSALLYLSGYFLASSLVITLAVIETLCVIAIGIGIQFKQSRLCAILLILYVVLGWGINLANGGIGSVLFTIVAIMALTYTFQFSKAWKAYRQRSVS